MTRSIPRLSVNPAQIYRLFYPQVPTILASRHGKHVAAMPANSCMPVSDKPVMFAVAVRKGLKTNEVLKRSKYFSVNWLDFVDRKLVSLLSTSNESLDKLAALKIPYFEVKHTPVLGRAQAYAICEMKSVQDSGDHDLFTGEVFGAMASLDFDECWKFEEYRPILYLGSELKVPFETIPARKRR